MDGIRQCRLMAVKRGKREETGKRDEGSETAALFTSYLYSTSLLLLFRARETGRGGKQVHSAGFWFSLFSFLVLIPLVVTLVGAACLF